MKLALAKLESRFQKTAEALESTLLSAVTDSSKYFHIIVKAYPLAPISDNKEPSFGIYRVKPCETLTYQDLT